MKDITVRLEDIPDAVDVTSILERTARQMTGRDCKTKFDGDAGTIVVTPVRPAPRWQDVLDNQ